MPRSVNVCPRKHECGTPAVTVPIVARIVTATRARVGTKNKGLDELSVKLGIPLVKRADNSTVVPTAVSVGAKIASLMPATRKRRRRCMYSTLRDSAQSCRYFRVSASSLSGRPQAFS